MQKIVLALILILSTFNTAFAENFECQVNSVHDGDTFTCKDGLKIRIWGIDTPEVPPKVKKTQPGGIEAKDFLIQKILNKKLNCTKKGKSYKRTVALCTANGQDIAKELLNKKLAKEDIKYSKGYYSNHPTN